MWKSGYLVLQDGLAFKGQIQTKSERAGEVVFNTSHSGYEEMSTDPSYYNQILVTTAPMQGNYGVSRSFWESKQLWISGFVCLEVQESARDHTWIERLLENNIPLLQGIDTRRLVLHLREKGTTWGALVEADSEVEAKQKAEKLIARELNNQKDWAYEVSAKEVYSIEGQKKNGLRVAVLDFGSKENILRELKLRCEEIKVFPSRATAQEIRDYEPHGIMLSNGPGNPEDVEVAVETIRELLGWRYIFGICMGHQLLSRALGAKTYKLKFGHRGSNHPIKDEILNRVYMTSQNHGYAVDSKSLPGNVSVTHTNLNDQTVAGIACEEKKCMSVQFHPESHPGPHDAVGLFDEFLRRVQ